jgi:transposase-like protein
MIQRGGEVLMHMVENVQQVTITPLITSMISPGSCIYTDEYDIYARLEQWGYTHQSVCHGTGEYARDDDGDGFHEVHVNTMEGFWSLLRSWLRPHRGISQENLPLYLAMVRTKSGGDSTVRPEFVIRGMLFHPTWLKG